MSRGQRGTYALCPGLSEGLWGTVNGNIDTVMQAGLATPRLRSGRTKGVLVFKLILILAIVALLLGAARLRRPARSAGAPERQNGSGGA